MIGEETITDLRNELKAELRPIIMQLWREGQSRYEIKKAVQAYKQAKIQRFYQIKEDGNVFLRLLEKLKTGRYLQKPDGDIGSKAEIVFYDLLTKYKIPFEYQVNIGQYRVDFLINKYLVFEGDGPCHVLTKKEDTIRDKYLEKLGYKIFRASWELVSQLPMRFIEVIKEELEEQGRRKVADV